MRAILLAAGRGRRLEASGWLEPKCLLPFRGTTILDNMLDALVTHEVADVTLVVGYRQEQVRAAVEARSDVRATWIENPDYETTNTINSLWRAREFMHEDFLYFNADVLFHRDVVGRLLAAKGSRLALDHKSCAEEEVKVVLDEAGRVLEIGKKLDPARCAGEFIGIAKFEAAMNEAFIASLERHNIELGNVNLFFEAALHDIVEEHPLHEVDVSDLPAIEIDFPDDLEQAREKVAPLIIRNEADQEAGGAHRR
jgi:choline kinase